MLKNKIPEGNNIFASGFRPQALGLGLHALGFRRAACSVQRAAIYGILFLFCQLLTPNCQLFAQDEIIAIVNEDAITQKDLNDFINFIRIQLSEEFKGEEMESKIQSMKLDLLDKLIEDRLILQEAKRNKIKIDESRVKARIDEIRKRYPSDAEFQNALSLQGMTQADIELKIKEQLLMYTIIDINVRSKIVVKPTEVTDFYQKNIEKFNTPEQREIASITIDKEEIANDIFNSLKNGGDLNNIASKYSLAVNKISIHQDEELKKEIKDAIFKLNPGEVSQPIKIDNSFYIFRLDNIVMARQQKLSEVQEKIQSFLYDIKMQENLSKWLDELKKRSYIKIFQD